MEQEKAAGLSVAIFFKKSLLAEVIVLGNSSQDRLCIIQISQVRHLFHPIKFISLLHPRKVLLLWRGKSTYSFTAVVAELKVFPTLKLFIHIGEPDLHQGIVFGGKPIECLPLHVAWFIAIAVGKASLPAQPGAYLLYAAYHAT